MFDLNQAVVQWRSELRSGPNVQRADLDELESHLRDTIESLEASGLDSEEAFCVARHRIGDVPSIQAEFRKVKRDFVGTRPLLTVLGSVFILVGLLAYSEFTIQEFKQLENDRAHLYAHLYALAVSPEVSDQGATVIFRDIIQNPKISFPLIVTDARGHIQAWKGCGVADSADPTEAGLKQTLNGLMEEMDRTNPPIPLSFSSEEPLFFLHYGTPRLVDRFDLPSLVKGGILFLLLAQCPPLNFVLGLMRSICVCLKNGIWRLSQLM